MNPIENFKKEVAENIRQLGEDKDLQGLSRIWSRVTNQHGYTYNFSWLGRPIIQYPQDMSAWQELIWQTKPDLIIETGIAHGGSLIFSASMLALLDMSEAIESGATLDPKNSERKVLGIDIDIRAHNRAAIEAHPMASRIQMIQGSSIAPEIIEQVNLEEGNGAAEIVVPNNASYEPAWATYGTPPLFNQLGFKGYERSMSFLDYELSKTLRSSRAQRFLKLVHEYIRWELFLADTS